MPNSKVKHYVSKEQDESATWRFLRNAWRPCPWCGAKPYFQYIWMYMTLHKDGQVWCDSCVSYLGMWDEANSRVEHS